ncbi:hypothetical protein GOQ27_01275 [Clostridium sp. D2Q-11]|uniref:Uncharacterized protein n=1 Tax=Anaeromonas frigoriresistens TaxID=2683708 RepID=A0A942UUI1_9FIRM|nr:hypothetical protein [Anaeromonas frigoriresistens]MBS4537071.1 hypothetical protein [Anaeromonas frigoriresistens]
MKNFKKIIKYVGLICLLMIVTSVSVSAATGNVAYSTYYDGERAVIYFIGDNPGFYHVGGSLSWRNNNPGNLRWASSQIGSNNNFAIFKSYSDGYNAMKNLVFGTYGSKTIAEMIEIYAPSSENDTENYISFVESRTGMDRNTVLNSMNSTQQNSLLDVMITHEGYFPGTIVYTDIMLD